MKTGFSILIIEANWSNYFGYRQASECYVVDENLSSRYIVRFAFVCQLGGMILPLSLLMTHGIL